MPMTDIANLNVSDAEHLRRREELAQNFPAEVGLMVLEFRQRALDLRERATKFLRYIIFALVLGVVTLLLVHLFVERTVESAETLVQQTFLNQKQQTLETLRKDETRLDSRHRKVIAEMGFIMKGGGSAWHRLTSNTTATLYDLHFADAKIGCVVGREGTILRTTDGGDTWSLAKTGTKATLYEIHFADAETGWVVGSKGTILRTTDGGGTWSLANTGTKADLNRAYFADAKTGWVVGAWGTILRTTDGGGTWSSAKTGTKATLYDLHFADAKTGWVVGNGGTILLTTDGGGTWSLAKTGTKRILFKIHFADAKTGWVVGSEGTILRTTNGGENWASAKTGTKANLTNVHFTDAKTGWVVGAWGTILRTTDGGGTWSSAKTGTKATFYEIHFADAKTGWVVGNEGTILRTTDGGGTWTLANTGTKAILFKIHFADAKTGWVVGSDGTILATRDFDENLSAMSIDEQINAAKTLRLKEVFAEGGYTKELERVARDLGENKTSQNNLKADIEMLGKIRKNRDGDTVEGIKSTIFLQTNIIRGGTLALIIYMVQILVSLYRYNTRLSSFYDARADAILLSRDANTGFHTLVDALSPDHFDFGKQPKTPAGAALDIPRGTAAALRGLTRR